MKICGFFTRITDFFHVFQAVFDTSNSFFFSTYEYFFTPIPFPLQNVLFSLYIGYRNGVFFPSPFIVVERCAYSMFLDLQCFECVRECDGLYAIRTGGDFFVHMYARHFIRGFVQLLVWLLFHI